MKNKKVFLTKLMIILCLGLVLGVSCFFSKPIEKALGIGKKETSFVEGATIDDSQLTINYIDVGQGDSTLVCLPDKTTMLIDAGTSASANHIVKFLQDKNITTIDYFILTHSDSDHSGGAKKVFDNFEIKKVYRPFQISVDAETGEAYEYEDLGKYLTLYSSSINTVNSLVYKNFIKAAYTETYGYDQKAEVIVHHAGDKITSRDNDNPFTFEFFAPLVRDDTPISENSTRTTGYPTKYYNTSDSNNASSPIMLLEYKDSAFVFTGDAPEKVETDFLNSIASDEEAKARFEKVDVYQAGHHGSRTSSSQDFLNLIQPEFTVVSCGKDNSYGHPHEEFLNRINSLTHSVNDYLLRTDNLGDITFGYYEGRLVYIANAAGEGVVVYWWHIALGTFVVLSVIIISVKVSKNKKTTAKRIVKQTKKTLKQVSDGK